MTRDWRQIKAAMLKKMLDEGITQAELARKLNWKRQLVNRYLSPNSTAKPKYDKIVDMATALDTTVMALTGVIQNNSNHRDKTIAELLIQCYRDLAQINSPEDLRFIHRIIARKIRRLKSL